MKRTALVLLLAFVVFVGTLSCTAPVTIPVPPSIGDGWQTASLADVGLNERQIANAVEGIHDGTYPNVHSLLIVKDGKLVVEQYFPGHTWDYNSDQFRGDLVEFDRDTPHNLASVTKSVTSALVGIAIDRQLIEDADERVFAFFPIYAGLGDEGKETMTLEHLLTMRSGLEWNEMELPYSNQQNDLVQLFRVDDPVGYILSKPLVSEPGRQWYYSGGNTNLLGEVIRRATGQRMDRWAAEVLFEPLGITHYEWDYINPDFVHASGNLKLRPRDMAKFGLLFLNGGEWNDQQILSREWIEASTEPHAAVQGGQGYGYQWWLQTYRLGKDKYPAFYASGWGGQIIMVFPDLELVVVFTGGNYVSGSPVDEIITRHILPGDD